MSLDFGAILLAGGRASRMGGIDKPGLLIDGTSLRDRAIAAVRDAGAAPIIAVGPEVRSDAEVLWAREDPPFSGPAAAVISGLRAMEAAPEWTVLLACDLAHADVVVGRLLGGIPNLSPATQGLCLSDAGGRPQWLTGVYRTKALRAAAEALGDGRDQAVRALLTGLDPVLLPALGAEASDVDTWQDYEELTKEHP